MKKIFTLFLGVLILCLGYELHAQEEADFYEAEKIQELNISFEQDNWRYLLDSLRFNGDEVLIGTMEINGEKFDDVGIRYRGTRSFQPGGNRNGLTIVLDYIKKGQHYRGYSEIRLSSALRDPSMVREVLSYEIARRYMPAPKANYASVVINSQFYGLLVNVESIGEKFLERNFGSNEGSLFKSNPDLDKQAIKGCKTDIYGSLGYNNGAKCYLQNYEILSESGWDDLIELTRVLKLEPEDVEGVLHIDRTLWMHAFNNVLVNLNSYTGQYSQNYFLYRDEKGRFNPVIWDLNLSFGSFKNTGMGSDLRTPQLQELDPMLHADNPARPLISVLLQNELYNKMYLSHMRTLLYDYFVKGDSNTSNFEKRAVALQELIREPLSRDSNWYYSMSEFDNSLNEMIGERSRIPGLVSFMEGRADFMRKHPKLAVIPPQVSGITVERREKFSSQKMMDFRISARVEKYAKRVKIYYRFSPDDEFTEASMLDDGKSNDGEANDEVYGVRIEPPAGADTLEYYLFAENAMAVSYDPPRYMHQLHQISLAEINR